MVLSSHKNLKLGIDVIRLFGNITLHVSLSKKNCKICSYIVISLTHKVLFILRNS